MRVLKKNLFILYQSVWLPIMFFMTLLFSAFSLYASGGNIGFFTVQSANINVFLLIFISLVSVYMVHSTNQFEYSFISAYKLIVCKYAASVLFTFSCMSVPIVVILILSIIRRVAVSVILNYISFIICSTFAECILITALAFLIAKLIIGKTAYIVSAIIAILFSPVFQNYVSAKRHELGNFGEALLNLLNITYDETFKVRFYMPGMPFNSETILSWIITFVFAAFIFFIMLFLISRKSGKSFIRLICTQALTVMLCAACIIKYFDNSVRIINFSFENGSIDEYVQDNKEISVLEYKMKLDLGNVLHNICEMTIKAHNCDSLKFKLNECFDIKNVTLNNVKISSNFNRNGDYFEIGLNDTDADVITICVDYGGRINYANWLNIKINYCDYFSSYLTEVFAWYPKLLSESNNTVKNFALDISSNNNFVTNLNNNQLMSKGKQTVIGKATDIYIVGGFIGETYIDNMHVILPLEFKNNDSSKKRIYNLIEDIKSHEFIFEPLFRHTPSDIDEMSEEEMEAWYNSTALPPSINDSIDTILFIPIAYNFIGKSYVYEKTAIFCEETAMEAW